MTVSLAIGSPTTETQIRRTTESPTPIGVYWGYLSMMEGLIGRMKSEIGKSLTVIATGSLATLFPRYALLNGDNMRGTDA